jgi:hypothetical protein
VGSVAQWVVYSPNGTKRVLAAHRKLDDALDDLVYQEATYDEVLLLDFGVLRCERCSFRRRCVEEYRADDRPDERGDFWCAPCHEAVEAEKARKKQAKKDWKRKATAAADDLAA